MKERRRLSLSALSCCFLCVYAIHLVAKRPPLDYRWENDFLLSNLLKMLRQYLFLAFSFSLVRLLLFRSFICLSLIYHCVFLFSDSDDRTETDARQTKTAGRHRGMTDTDACLTRTQASQTNSHTNTRLIRTQTGI